MDTQTLTVLYYKRSSKVHKTGKEDGWLTIDASNDQVVLRDSPPTSTAAVSVSNSTNQCVSFNNGAAAAPNGGKRSALSQSDSEDDDEQEYTSKKAKWNAIRKNVMSTKGKNKTKTLGTYTGAAAGGGGMGSGNAGASRGVIYSGINREIAKRAASGGISEDDLLVIGPWECQVISIEGGNSEGSNSLVAKLPMGVATKSAAKPLHSGLHKRAIVGMKRPLSNTAAPDVSVRTGKLVLGSKTAKAAPVSTSIATAGITNKPSVAATGKMKKDKNGEWYLDQQVDSENEDETKAAVKPALKRGPLKSLKSTLVNKGVKGVGSVKPIDKSTNKSTNTIAKATNNEFPGAIGTINLPPSIQKVLRPHQREGIAFLWNCVTGVSEGIKRVSSEIDGNFDSDGEQAELMRGAVLADEMGLGKTLMTISTIYALHRQSRSNRFIVVCPSSLVTNWSKEFDKWIGKASNPKRVIVRSGAEEGIRSLKSFVMSQQAEVLILSYELFRLHVNVISKAKKIGLLVVDEGHRLKNTSGSQTLSALNCLSAEARILITGTPIQNNLGEFYNLAQFVLPGILGELADFRRVYERPMTAANKKNASKEEKERGRVQSKALDQITKTFVLRRLQKDVLKSLLPPRMELLMFCRLSSKQRELYREIADRTAKSIESIGGRDENPLMLLTDLRKLCTHPQLLDQESSAGSDAALSGKMLVLDALLESIRQHSPTDKVVIISNFTSALSVVESSILRKKNLPFVRLDGTVELSARQPIVDSFNSSSINHSLVFLLSSKAGGCGLNLIGANRLIMLDADWNPATDQQAMARVYRQGQQKPCFIYRMFTTATVEEVIFQRQTQKRNLAQLANGGGKSNSSFTPEELRDCFTLSDTTTCDTKDKLGVKWPDYNGVSSLHTQGCTDQPLLAVCEDLKGTISFVRVADEEPVIDWPNLEDDASSTDENSDEAELSLHDEDVSSTSEEEFGG